MNVATYQLTGGTLAAGATVSATTTFDMQAGTVNGVRGSVAPKYRNPDNPAETWAGRGLKPRWLAAALKSGKKLEHFSIAAPAKTATMKKMPKKTRRPAKK